MRPVKPLIVTHVGMYSNRGGAAAAMMRVHGAVKIAGEKHQVTSRVRAAVPGPFSVDVSSGLPPGRQPLESLKKVDRKFRKFAARRISKSTHSVVSIPPFFATGLGRELNADGSDIINLHWLGSGTLSLREIQNIRKPIVWRLADLWAAGSVEHYPARNFVHDEYRRSSSGDSEFARLALRHHWIQKKRRLNFPFVAVCPSSWTMEMAQESAVFSRASCVIIPNPLDTEFWRPSVSSAFENSAAPDESSRPLRLLFGAVGGLEDPRKGWGLLRDALAHLKVSRPDILIHLEIFGQTGVFERSGSQSTTYLGTLSEEGMRKAYRHADVFVATPLAESFGQTVTEAQACGTPVIGTAAGGLKDTIMPGKTGHLVGARDYFELAARLAETFDFPRQTMEMGVNARERAERLWSMQTVGDQYVELYRRVFFSTTVL